MTGLWSAEQREWLHAMGHTVWSVAPPDALAAERQPHSPDAAASDGPRGAMREAASLLGREERSPRPAPARPTPPARTGSPAQTGDRLMQALLRASGGSDEAGVKDLVGDIGALRGNAAAKRALWPRLRALRKAPRG